MIVKRVAAITLAAILIAAAWVVRDRIDSDSADADEPVNAGVLVCATELADLCRVAVGDRFDVVADPAGTTLDLLATDTDPVLWLTFDLFPQMMNDRRAAAALPPIGYTATELGSSRLAAITRLDTTGELAEACGDPVDLGCVGEQTRLSPAVSPVDSGLGLLAIAAAFAARTDDPMSLDDVDLLSWARAFRRASERVALSGGTAVQTIQTRSSVSVALGVEAELSASRRDDFDVLYAAPMARARVVLLKPTGFDVEPEVVADLTDALVTRGWDDDPTPSDPDAFPPTATMIGIREYWSDLS